MLMGIGAALLGTLFQALNFCLIKEAELRHGLKGLRLLIASHLVMGLICLLPFVVFSLWEGLNAQSLKLIAFLDFCYILSQYCFFTAVRKSDPSTASPYMILKLPVVALIAVFYLQQSLNWIQLAAVIAIVALSLNFTRVKGKAGPAVLGLVTLTCICLSLCDVAVLRLTALMPFDSPLKRALAGTCYYFVSFLIFLLPFALVLKTGKRELWLSRNVALSWVTGVALYITSFFFAGLLAANIIISLRALFAVLLVLLFFREHLQGGRPLTGTKLITATLLCASVTVYHLAA